jgi:hypothetical protein
MFDVVSKVDDMGAEGAGLEEFEAFVVALVGEERGASADEYRMDADTVLVDEMKIRRLGAEPGPTDADLTIGLLCS